MHYGMGSQHQANAGGTPSSQMAARAAANANQVRDAVGGLGVQPEDPSAETKSIIRGSANSPAPGTPNDPLLQNALQDGAPGALANPFANPALRGVPGTLPPQPPSPLRTHLPAFGTTGVPAFHSGR